MKSQQFDVIVIGGGITGAGIARDAALRGLSVALIEKGDFASGTSSKSARMVHGGFRYLEQFQFGLVINSCAERRKLLNIAPRLVRPAAFVFPVYHRAKNSLAKINLGMWLYEFLALFRNVKRHRIMPPEEVRASEPAILQKELDGAIRYYDCLADDARLTLATIKAAHMLGAIVANYVEVTNFIKENSKVVGVEARDVLSGQPISIRGKVVANATGVWVDKIRIMDDPKAEMYVRANRGSHIILPRERVPINDVVIFTSTDGKRGMYAVPWGNTVIVGTTDLDHTGDLDDVHATSEETQSMLAAVNQIFPDAHMTANDIISTYAGLRPLLGGKEITAYQASRDHEILDSPSGLMSITGGKLTAHRKMAEDMVDQIMRKLNTEGYALKAQSMSSSESPIVDPTFDTDVACSQILTKYPKFSQDILSHLVNTHGSDAETILTIANENKSMAQPLITERPYIYAEIPYAIQYEMAITLSDFLVRRTHIIYESKDQGLSVAQSVAQIMGRYLEWDADQVDRNINAYVRQVEISNVFRQK
jgi:glycerol-3-phosphate dehydrogenase